MTKQMIKTINEEQEAQLSAIFPKEEKVFEYVSLPTFGMESQDQTKETGKGRDKKIEIIASAGTFFIERPTDEVEVKEDGSRKIWEKIYIEEENPQIIILYQRKRLYYFDEEKEEYTSSIIFDRDDEEIILFKNKKEVARGTVAELKNLYPTTTAKGRASSLLKDERILYVLYKNELLQIKLHGTSMWEFVSYARKTVVPSVVTSLSSEFQEKGTISWNKMTFNVSRKIDADEYENVISKISEIKEEIGNYKNFFSSENENDNANIIYERIDKPF